MKWKELPMGNTLQPFGIEIETWEMKRKREKILELLLGWKML